jgi:hypothetical protein
VQEQQNSLHPSLLLFFQIIFDFSEHHFCELREILPIKYTTIEEEN